jgi:hypothetical protein
MLYHLAVDAVEKFEAFSFATAFGPRWPIEIGSIEEDDIREDLLYRAMAMIAKHGPNIKPEPQEVVDTFEALRLQGKSESWHLIARRCKALADAWGMAGRDYEGSESDPEEKVIGSNGEEENWSEYWHRAQGWAEGQLGQNELREYQRWIESEASETRLKRYFFGDSWKNIPQKERERLVNADLFWFSEARHDIGAILNELQVAAEAMCYDFFVGTPPRCHGGGQELFDFMQKNTNLKSKGFQPTLLDYAWMCREQFFRTFVHGRGASEESQHFLTKTLPDALDDLRKARESAQHDPQRRWQREEVGHFFQLFLGIGNTGVLKRLVELGPKVASG